jgi:hypothetical protein
VVTRGSVAGVHEGGWVILGGILFISDLNLPFVVCIFLNFRD